MNIEPKINKLILAITNKKRTIRINKFGYWSKTGNYCYKYVFQDRKKRRKIQCGKIKYIKKWETIKETSSKVDLLKAMVDYYNKIK